MGKSIALAQRVPPFLVGIISRGMHKSRFPKSAFDKNHVFSMKSTILAELYIISEKQP